MSGLEAIQAVASISGDAAITAMQGPEQATNVSVASFGDMLSQGVQQVEAKIESANGMVRAFALDDSLPIHQVTIAIEEARMAVELAVQVRSRLVEGYREIMNMQL